MNEIDEETKYSEYIENATINFKQDSKEKEYYVQKEVTKKTDSKIGFPKPLVDDNIECDSHGNEITICRVVQRINHLLEYYTKHAETSTSEQIVPIFEYISSINNYTTSMLMEDWNHAKMTHFKSENDYIWVKSLHRSINCTVNDKCEYVSTHRRKRGREIYNIKQETDHRNIILKDIIASVHTFIFHPTSVQRHRIPNTISIGTELEDIDEKSNELDVWDNKPVNIKDCNQEQLLYILNHGDLFSLKLQGKKSDIIKYVKQQKLDGNKLIDMKRKTFISAMAEYFGDNKLRGQLGKLYTSVTKLDLSQFVSDNDQNIWTGEHKSIEDCELEHIVYIINNEEDIFKKLDKLVQYKQEIIGYIQQNGFDGKTLKQTKRKDFITNIVKHFGDNKLRGAFGRLHSALMKIDVTKYATQDNNTQEQKTNEPQNTKFVTELETNEAIKPSYYSFGEQYRYTANLRQHPLFVSAKYESIKEELYEYFKKLNESNDKIALLQSQLNSINSDIDSTELQSMMKLFLQYPASLNEEQQKRWPDENAFLRSFNGVVKKFLWVEDDSITDMIKLVRVNCSKVTSIVNTVLPDFEYSVNSIFTTLLDAKLQQKNNNMKKNIEKYLITMEYDEFLTLLDKLYETGDFQYG
eukprot:468031_1